jgi:predicted ATPase/DNA-binding winged helix-turn-helix (wHTH) protein
MDVSISEEGSFTFGPFLFRPDHQILLKGNEEIRLGSRAVTILHLLVARSRTLVTKDDLIAHAWPSTTVDEANLKVHICTLRRVLGDTKRHTGYIATIPGRGYQFVAQVLMTNAKSAGLSYDVGPSQQGLPSELEIVGRDQEIKDVATALTPGSVVTLAGPVGVGKASIARAAAAAVRPRFDAGCCIVDFSLINDLSAVPNFVAAALGLRSTSTDMTGALLEYLEHRSILILLDHCERVMDALRLMISRLSASRTSSSFLLVSLEPLRVTNESVHRIGLLPYPAPGNWSELSIADALAYPAIAMLVDRAHFMSGYKLLKEDIAPIAGLCHITDGRPRSIASALSNLLGHFSFDEMLDIVTRRVLLGPQAGEPDDPTCLVSGKTDFGYGRLSSDEAALLRLLSVFAGAFELEDVVRMIEPTGWDAHQTFMLLSNLIAKSFIWVEPAGPVARYRILAAERFFGRAQLREAPGELEIASSRHARVILHVFEQAQTEWPWVEPEAWRARYAMRSEDLIDAIEWAAGAGADAELELKLTALAIRLWDEQADLGARRMYLKRALEAGTNSPKLSNAISKIATSHAWSLTLSGELGDPTSRAWADAVEFAENNADDACQFSAITEYCGYLILIGKSRLVPFEIPKLEALAKRAKNRQFETNIERFKSFMAFDAGDIDSTRNMLRSAAEDLEMTSTASLASRYRWDRYVTINSNLSLINFISGPSDEAPSALNHLEALVNECHPRAQALFLIITALPIAHWRRDHIEMDRLVALYESSQRAARAYYWDSIVQFYAAVSGHLKNEAGSFNRMRKLVDQFSSRGLHRRLSLHLSIVSEAAFEIGKTELATELLGRAFQQQECCQELWYVPELIRVEARQLCAAGHPLKALNRLGTAADKAATMGTHFFGRRIHKEAAAMRMLIGGGLERRRGSQVHRYRSEAAH